MKTVLLSISLTLLVCSGALNYAFISGLMAYNPPQITDLPLMPVKTAKR